MKHRHYEVISLCVVSLLSCTVGAAAPSPALANADSTTENQNLNEYKKEITKILEQKLKNEDNQKRKGTVVVEIKINRLGIIISNHVVESSGNLETDSIVIAAAEVGTLLPRFPAEMSAEYLTIQIPVFFGPSRADGGTSQTIDKKPDCSTLLKTNIEYEATIRSDSKTLTKDDKTVVRLDPDIQQLRVKRLRSGYAETAYRRSPMPGKVISYKLYDNVLETINEQGERTKYEYDPPLSENAPPGKENRTEIYTRTIPGQPSQTFRVENIFEREDIFEVSTCKVPVYRYRVNIFREPSSDQAPLSTAIKDYSPDLRIALRQQSTSKSVTLTRTVTSISTDLPSNENK